MRRLVAETEVLIENFRPGTLEGWGLGWETLSAIDPGLVMLRVSGFGQTGPYRDRPGFGVIAEAMGGLRHLTGEPGRTPVRVGVSLDDSLSALHGVIGVLLALRHREQQGGQGQVVDGADIADIAADPHSPVRACAGRTHALLDSPPPKADRRMPPPPIPDSRRRLRYA